MLRDAIDTPHERFAATPRIVSLVPSITELLFDLGLGEYVVGRTTFCIHPAQPLKAVPSVGGTKKPKLEKIAALTPTHLIVNIDENLKEDVDALKAFVPHIIVTHPLEPGDNLPLYELLGHIFDRTSAADELGRRFSAARAQLQSTRNPIAKRVLYLIWRDPWMTISSDTYISQMLAEINWQTVGHRDDVRYPEFVPSADFINAHAVDMVLFSSEPFPFKTKHIDEFLALVEPARPAVYEIDGEMVSWYGSRAIEGLDYLARFAANRGNCGNCGT